MERVDSCTPTSIIQLFQTPYLEFSAKFYNQLSGSLLDCACGNMYQTPILKERFVSVTSIDKEFKPNVDNFFAVDLEQESLPFADNTFDLVFSFETIEHLDQSKQLAFVNELIRVAKYSIVIGSVSVDGPNYIDGNLIFKAATDTNSFHKHEFTSKEWQFWFSRNFWEYTRNFYHLKATPVYKIESGLNPEFGICNYVEILKPSKI